MGAAPQPTPTPKPSQYYSDGRGKANDYQPPAPIQSSWPQLSAAGDLTVHRDTLRQVAKAMETDIQDVQATLADLYQNGLVSEGQLGSWDAPTSLASATVSAYAGITQFVNDLVAAHAAVVERINRSANAYNDAESSNTAAVQSVGQASGGSGLAPQAGYPGAVPVSQGGVVGSAIGGGSVGGGHGSLAGFNPPPSGGVGVPGVGGVGGPGAGGAGLGGPGLGGLPGGGSPGAYGPIAYGPIIGGPASGGALGGRDPLAGEPLAGEPLPGGDLGEPVIGVRGIGFGGGGSGATAIEGQTFGERSVANGLGIAGGEDPMATGEIPGEASDGVGFMPMAGGGGRGERDHDRATWRTGDRDIWGEQDDVTPPVIGGPEDA